MQKLTVYKPYRQEAIRPVGGHNGRTFLIDSNPLEMSVVLEKNMFFPGESVKGILNITNYSSKRIDSVIVNLQQTVNLNASTSSTMRQYSIRLGTLLEVPVIQGQPTKVSFDVKVPEDLYCSISGTTLVHNRYEFQIVLD